MAYFTSNTDQQILLASSIITSYVGGTMFILGTVGNIMNIIIFCCLKSYRSLPTSAFLAAASFAGQVYLILELGFSSLFKLTGYNISSRNSAICKSILYLKTVSMQITLTCLCLSSIDRYLMTTRSVRLRGLITLKRARFIICICTVAWSCIEVPNALYTLNVPSFDLCLPSAEYTLTQSFSNLIFAILLPIIILSVFGLLTWKNLGHTRLTALNAQVTKMILLDVIIVALSNIPLGSFYIYTVTKRSNQLSASVENLLLILAQLLSSTQSAGCFYFYWIISSAFRANAKRVFCFWKPIRIGPMGHSTVIATARPTAMPKVVV